MIDLLVDSLAAWRLALMLVNEAGPLHIFRQLRRETGAETINAHGNVECRHDDPIVGVFCCLWCMSVWTAAMVRWLRTGKLQVVETLAVSAGAIVIDRAINS